MQMAARLSQVLGGHVISCKLSRNNHNHLGGRQYDCKGSHTVGYNKDGTLVAWQGTWSCNGGSASGMWYGLNKTYKIPYIGHTSNAIYTNTPARNPWRCVLDQEGSFTYDLALDVIANDFGHEPLYPAHEEQNIMAKTDTDRTR